MIITLQPELKLQNEGRIKCRYDDEIVKTTHKSRVCSDKNNQLTNKTTQYNY
jgi:hypothetical protein